MVIAWKNIMSRKWSSTRVALSIFVMVIIMCIFTAYSIALGDETERVVNSYRSGHNFIIESARPLPDEKIEQAKNIKGVGQVVSIATYRNTQNLRNMTFEIDGKEYACEHWYYDEDLSFGTDNFVNKLHFGDFAFVKAGEHIALPYHSEELEYRFSGHRPILAGTDVVKDNEIIVSEYFLEEFGLTTDVVNKKIKIKTGNIDGKPFEDIVIVGVMDKTFFQLTNTYDQHFIMSTDSSLWREYSKDCKFQTKLYVENSLLNESLINQIKQLGYFNIRAGSEVGLSMATTVQIIGNILTGAMATVGVGIISALILNIVYSMRFMITKKSNFYGIMQVYGMKKKDMFNTMFCEMLILSLFAIVFAYGVSYGLVYLLDYIISNLLGIGVFFTWPNFLITFAVAICFTLIVVLVVSLINYSLCYKRTTAKLLRNTIEN